MRGRHAFVAFAMIVVLLAGCIDPTGGSSSAKAKKAGGALQGVTSKLLTPATTPLWYNPETFPHPAYNFPTLSNPAQGADVSPWLKPIPMGAMPAKISGFKHVAQVTGATSGAGMSLIGSLAILPASPTRIVDISDPTHPKAIGSFQTSTRASDTIVYPDGRIVAVLVGGPNLYFVDITDPTNPVQLSQVKPRAGAHKVDVVPGTPIVYNSPSNGGAGDPAFGITGDLPSQAKGYTEIFDLSDPMNPKNVTAFQNGYGCHRIYFYIEPSQDYYRAICAGIEVTQLWDIKDPLAPKLVVNVPVWHGNPNLPANAAPPVTFSHFAILSRNHKVLIVGDEMGGGAAQACGAYANPGPHAVSTPLGALWFYDVSNEKSPVLKGWMAPSTSLISNQAGLSCTAHHGRLVPDPEGKRDLLAMAYYGAGTLLVDFTDPSNAFIVDQFNQGTSTWEAWYYNGYVFTGDGRRGLDAIGFR